MDPAMMQDPSVEALYEELVSTLFDLRLVNYFQIVAVVALVYDYLITLGMEIRYIWPARWNLLKILYLLQRYLPFFDTGALLLWRQFALNPSIDHCRLNYNISGWTLTAGITLCEIILTYRVWAVQGRGSKMGVFLLVLFLVCWGPTLFLTYDLFSSITFGPPPVPMRGCFIAGASDVSWIEWIILLGYETALMLLMAWSARKSSASRKSLLANLVYRDGIVYFIYLFLLSVANVLVLLLLPKSVGQILAPLERVMYSLLSSRVVLHIREFVDTHGNAGTADLSTASALTIRQHMERKTYPELHEIDMSLRYSTDSTMRNDNGSTIDDTGSYIVVVYGEAV